MIEGSNASELTLQCRLLVLRVVGHLPWLLACCELGWAGVGQASGEETAGGLRSVFLQMWSMEI